MAKLERSLECCIRLNVCLTTLPRAFTITLSETIGWDRFCLHRVDCANLTLSDLGMTLVPPQELHFLYFEDLVVGDAWVSPARTVTESDVVSFACLSGDFNAIHVDHEFAKSTPFGRPIAHGLLGIAMASGLSSQSPRVATLAFLGIHQWSFLEPLFIGDTIHVVTTVTALEPRSRGRRVVVTWHRKITNQAGRLVQEGLTRTLVQSKRQLSKSGNADARCDSTSSEDLCT